MFKNATLSQISPIILFVCFSVLFSAYHKTVEYSVTKQSSQERITKQFNIQSLNKVLKSASVTKQSSQERIRIKIYKNH